MRNGGAGKLPGFDFGYPRLGSTSASLGVSSESINIASLEQPEAVPRKSGLPAVPEMNIQ
jgi:hypothetical protein